MPKTKSPAAPTIGQLMTVVKGFSHANPWIAEYTRCALARILRLIEDADTEATKDPVTRYLGEMIPGWWDELTELWEQLGGGMRDAEFKTPTWPGQRLAPSPQRKGDK